MGLDPVGSARPLKTISNKSLANVRVFHVIDDEQIISLFKFPSEKY